MSITDTRLSIGFQQRLIIVDNPSVSDFGNSQRGSVCRAKVEGNYADLEFAREVIEGLSHGYTWWREVREGLRSGAFDLLFGFRFMALQVGDRLINPPQFAASESDHRLSALGIGAGARGSVAVGTS
jgi:hypothetical protein